MQSVLFLHLLVTSSYISFWMSTYNSLIILFDIGSAFWAARIDSWATGIYRFISYLFSSLWSQSFSLCIWGYTSHFLQIDLLVLFSPKLQMRTFFHHDMFFLSSTNGIFYIEKKTRHVLCILRGAFIKLWRSEIIFHLIDVYFCFSNSRYYFRVH